MEYLLVLLACSRFTHMGIQIASDLLVSSFEAHALLVICIATGFIACIGGITLWEAQVISLAIDSLGQVETRWWLYQ